MKPTYRVIVLGLALILALFLLAVARAEEPSSVPRAPLYGPPRYVAFVADLEAPAVMVPVEFAVQAMAVITCESRWNTEAVGKAGERGLFQIHPIHKPRMAELGLDFEQERDRVIFAEVLWEAGGRTWTHWACHP